MVKDGTQNGMSEQMKEKENVKRKKTQYYSF